MKPLFFSLYASKSFTKGLRQIANGEFGELITRQFPDDEIYIQFKSDLKKRDVIFLATLDRANSKMLLLFFAALTAKSLGASSVGLIAPYLAYMRQDKQFHPGEGVTSQYFAKLISNHFDWMTTIDPHLHRYHALNEIYSIPTTVLHATQPICDWIKSYVIQPIIIGPDSESEQWVKEVAQSANAPYLILEKIRKGDLDVEISIPDLDKYQNCTPVLVDDIISTAKTMIETVKHLHALKMKKAICIGIHAIFAENAYEALLQSGVEKIVTCNTVSHATNLIDVSELAAQSLRNNVKLCL